MNYHKVTCKDCLSVATEEEGDRLDNITDINLLKTLAIRWCCKYGYKLGGYLGWSKSDSYSWDATLKNACL